MRRKNILGRNRYQRVSGSIPDPPLERPLSSRDPESERWKNYCSSFVTVMQVYQNRISRLIAQVRNCMGLLRGLPRLYDMVKIVLDTQHGDPESIKSALLGGEARLKEELIRGAELLQARHMPWQQPRGAMEEITPEIVLLLRK